MTADILKSYQHIKILAQTKQTEIHLARFLNENSQSKLVAIKHFNSLQEWMLESSIHRQFNHPNIVRFHEAISDKNGCRIVMEFIRKGSLKKKLLATKKNPSILSPRKIFNIVKCIAKALEHIHEKGFIHGDLSPSNILLEKNFNAKLADFGFCKQTPKNTYLLGGTIRYMAPEHLEKEPCDCRSDLFSLTCIMYEMLSTDYLPMHFSKQLLHLSYSDISSKIRENSFIFNKLRHFFTVGLHPDPSSRFRSALSFIQALELIENALSNEI